MKKEEHQTEDKQTVWGVFVNFWYRIKEALVALYQRLKQWPIGWLINLGLSVLIFFLLIIMFITYRKDERAVTHNQAATEQVSKVDDYLAQMTLEEKVGQLFMARVPVENQVQDLQTYHLGGYLLFERDVWDESLDSLREKIASYQAAATTPLLIGSDEEGGEVSRLASLLETPFAQPQALFAEGGMPAVLADLETKAELLKDLGIHTGFFPVADMATDPYAFIYPRTLGQDLATTQSYVAETTKVLRGKNLLSTLKHFPGYGDNADSHYGLVYDYRSLEDLQALDLQVFEAGIKAGADSVLVTHNILAEIEEVPASLSSQVNRILREDLGFKGVVMTDDFDMEGLAQFTSQEEAAYLAILAGNDMILSSQHASQIPYLLEKVATGELTEERIDESVRRILTMKETIGLLN